MPTLSVITAVLAGKHQYLPELYTSLVDQELPAGWDWEWLVQEDGETGEPLSVLPTDPRISAGTGSRGRAATARNIALGRAGGVLTRAVDADDRLTAGALARDIATITGHPGTGWCVSAVLDLLADGTLRPGPRDPDPGGVPPGFFLHGARVGLLQVLGVTLCAYTELIRFLGGWSALPTQEDVELLLAAEALCRGRVASGVSLHYRRWPGATTFGMDKSGAYHGDSRIADVVHGRIAALNRSGFQWAPREVPLAH